ncbi:hypothetical protein B0H66DRAFT_614213 [Apodospora peruviana]|uniref:Uncharacterized protein n=1 Tax=Apodospora peruviana TaxID=516989 RepID=A0AAE0HSQ9_9PEZI|nr:hypothetical protein B0H66DRAFT_614213 [Apodospora peruviana]
MPGCSLKVKLEMRPQLESRSGGASRPHHINRDQNTGGGGLGRLLQLGNSPGQRHETYQLTCWRRVPQGPTRTRARNHRRRYRGGLLGRRVAGIVGMAVWARGGAEEAQRTKTVRREVEAANQAKQPRPTDTTNSRAVGPFMLRFIRSKHTSRGDAAFSLQVISYASGFNITLGVGSSIAMKRDILRPSRVLFKVPRGTSTPLIQCSQDLVLSLTFAQIQVIARNNDSKLLWRGKLQRAPLLADEPLTGFAEDAEMILISSKENGGRVAKGIIWSTAHMAKYIAFYGAVQRSSACYATSPSTNWPGRSNNLNLRVAVFSYHNLPLQLIFRQPSVSATAADLFNDARALTRVSRAQNPHAAELPNPLSLPPPRSALSREPIHFPLTTIIGTDKMLSADCLAVRSALDKKPTYLPPVVNSPPDERHPSEGA